MSSKESCGSFSSPQLNVKETWYSSELTDDQLKLLFGPNIFYTEVPFTCHSELNDGQSVLEVLKQMFADMNDASFNVTADAITEEFIDNFEKSYNAQQKKEMDEFVAFASGLFSVGVHDGSRTVREKMQDFCEKGFSSFGLNKLGNRFLNILSNETDVTSGNKAPKVLHKSWLDFYICVLECFAGKKDGEEGFCRICSTPDASFSFEASFTTQTNFDGEKTFNTKEVKTFPDGMVFLRKPCSTGVTQARMKSFPVITLKVKTHTITEDTAPMDACSGYSPQELQPDRKSGKRLHCHDIGSPSNVKRLGVSSGISTQSTPSTSSRTSNVSPNEHQFWNLDSPGALKSADHSRKRTKVTKNTPHDEDGVEKMRTEHFAELLAMMKDRNKSDYARPSRIFGIYAVMGRVYFTCLKMRNDESINNVHNINKMLKREMIQTSDMSNDRSPFEWNMICCKPLYLLNPVHLRAFFFFVNFILIDQRNVDYFED